MDTHNVWTEVALVDITLRDRVNPVQKTLVAGLGAGHTLQRAMSHPKTSDSLITICDNSKEVIEAWLRNDYKTRMPAWWVVHQLKQDFFALPSTELEQYDVILIDIDNTIEDSWDASMSGYFYTPDGFREFLSKLSVGTTVGIWLGDTILADEFIQMVDSTRGVKSLYVENLPYDKTNYTYIITFTKE